MTVLTPQIHRSLVRLLTAPARGGKTHACVERVQAVLKAEPHAQIRVCLPDLQQQRAFVRALRSGTPRNLQVTTFYELYHRLLEQLGTGSPAPLSEVEQGRILRRVLSNLCHAGQIPTFAHSTERPGFRKALIEMIAELKRARCSPQNFSVMARQLGRGANELATIYQAYQEQLQTLNVVDSEGRGWLATEALEGHPTLAANWRLLIFDGFDAFNATQLAAIKGLSQQTIELWVTLTASVDGETERLALRRFNRTRKKLENVLGVPAQPLPPPSLSPGLAPALASLEAGLYVSGPDGQSAVGPSRNHAITLLEASGRAAEARGALRWLKGLLAHGWRANEVAILARRLDPYRGLLEECAAGFGIPLHFISKLSLASNPCIAAILALIQLSRQGFASAALSDTLRSSYFNWQGWGLQPGDSVRYLLVAQRGAVVGGKDQWKDILERLAQENADHQNAGEVTEDTDETPLQRVPAGREADRLLQFLDSLEQRLEPLNHAKLAAHIAWLNALLGLNEAAPSNYPSLGVPACIDAAADTAERDRAAVQALSSALDGLERAYTLLGEGETPISRDVFLDELRSLIEASQYAPYDLHDTTTPAVQVVEITQTRGLSYKAVALLGLAEGEFPAPLPENPLLDSQRRQQLIQAGIQIEESRQADEVTFFYEAITRASQKLLLCRPQLTDDGQAWEPSPFWEEVERLLSKVAPNDRRQWLDQGILLREPRIARPPADSAASPVEWLGALAMECRHNSALEAHAEEIVSAHDVLKPIWQAAQRGAGILAARMARQGHGVFEGDLSALAQELSLRYGPNATWSSSRLESYNTCGFQFLVSYSLELAPRRPIAQDFDIAQMGSIYHDILHAVYSRAQPNNPNSLKAAVDSESERILATAPQDYHFRETAWWPQQKQEIVRRLKENIDALCTLPGEIISTQLEQGFDVNLPIGPRRETLRLGGKIDRLDQMADGHIRMIDYKSSSGPIESWEAERGRRLQLGLYTAAAEECGWTPVTEGFYWHLLSAQRSRLRLSTDPEHTTADMALDYAAKAVTGMRQGQFIPSAPTEGCKDFCAAKDFCWRYRPR